MVSAADTHEVFNQPPPFAGLNLFSTDPALGALVEGLPQSVIDQLAEHGGQWGTPETFDLGRLANDQPPTLRNFDATGTRIDSLEFHPAYHALMRRSVASGLQCSIWDAAGDEASVRAVARAARLYMTAEVDAGHLASMTMTNAAVAALAHAPSARRHVAAAHPHAPLRFLAALARVDKAGALVGMGLTEKQGGSDVGSNTTAAVEGGDGFWRITGHKWFLSAPASDAFLVLAQTVDGLTCFLVPRFMPDGSLNGMTLMRLKDKLGNRSNATAEVEFDHAAGWLVGESGRGFGAIVDMLTLTRLDSSVASAGMMRLALAEAVHHCRYRKASGQALVDQPLMTRVLADMALDAVAAAALAFRLAESYDRAADDPAEAAFARLMTPAVKYWVTKVAPSMIGEAMECLGGNGYIEESRLPRLYREAPANSWSLRVARCWRFETRLGQDTRAAARRRSSPLG